MTSTSLLRPAALACCLVLAACASTPNTPATSAPEQGDATAPAAAATAAAAPAAAAPAASAARNDTATDVGKAVTAPLSDLNIVKADIPPVLAAARKAPYAAPADRSCAALAEQIQALDAVLGADLDTPSTDTNPSLIERGANAVTKGAVSAVRGAAEGVVPMRSWVRKLTGAERYAREVQASITAGTIRRGYLKGLGQSAGCAAPAAPRAPVTVE